MFKKTQIFLLVSLLIISAVLAGCFGQQAKVTSDVGNSNIATIEGKRPEGIFNPILVSNDSDKEIVNLIFEGLVNINDDGEIVNTGIADSWDISEDGKEYTFYLRQRIKFHNGHKLTARDVAFTFAMIAHPDYTGPLFSNVEDIIGAKEHRNGKTADGKFTFPTIEGIVLYGDKPKTGSLPVVYDNSINNPYKITFKFAQANENTIKNLSTGILPMDYYQPIPTGAGHAVKHARSLSYSAYTFSDFVGRNGYPVGTGAYSFLRYQFGQSVELEAYKTYRLGRPKTDAVVFKVVE